MEHQRGGGARPPTPRQRAETINALIGRGNGILNSATSAGANQTSRRFPSPLATGGNGTNFFELGTGGSSTTTRGTAAQRSASMPQARSSSISARPATAGSASSSTLSGVNPSRRSNSSAASGSTSVTSTRSRSPRDLETLTLKLLSRLHGAQSPMTSRRMVKKLMDAPAYEPISPFVVLEKMRNKILAEPLHFNGQPQETVNRMNEVYSRLSAFKNMDRKSETLLLLYQLMNTAPLQDAVPGTPDLKAYSGLDQLHKQPQTRSQPPTPIEVDALEDSFKAFVGIQSIPSTRASTSRSMATDSGGVFGGPRSSEIPEEVLLRDVIFALQAIDSRHIFFDAAADRYQITRSVGVPTPMRELTHKLCELGWFYRKISEYLKYHREELSFGVVGQSFCHILNVQLSDYFRLIAVLASQVDDAAGGQLNNSRASELSLRKLIVWSEPPLHTLRLMSRLIDSVDGLRGGALASGIHSHILHGDPDVARYVQLVMKRVAAPIFRMIRRWVFEGELEDAHMEFFVVADASVADDRLWSHKYKLNLKMLPTFISIDLAKKILVIGKSINFIRQCCGNTDWVMDVGDDMFGSRVEEDDDGVHFAELKNLEVMIEKVSKTTNEYLIHTLNTKYHLLEHCRALKRYLLLGQGDFIQYLMDLLGPELSKQAAYVYRHTLTNVLETALNSSNAKFESTDILGRLDVELLQPSPGDTGWDIFSLHYKLTAPVNSIINDSAMVQYHRIFHFLWRFKRVEYSLAKSWSKDMNLSHEIQGLLINSAAVLHKCQILRSEMNHFTANLHSYMMFEVLETSWEKLVKDLRAAKDLDGLIESHEQYIATIKQNGFMMQDSKDLLTQLKLIFDTIIRFCKTQKNLYDTAEHEAHQHKTYQQTIERKTAEGTWGVTESEEYAARALQNCFNPNSTLVKLIDKISNEFGSQLQALLEMIKDRGTSGSQSLPFLLFRFDFNEYYRSKTSPAMETDE